MRFLKRAWNYISSLGLHALPPEKDPRLVIILNRLSFMLSLMLFILLITDILIDTDDYLHFRVLAQHLIFSFIAAVFPLFLNARGFHFTARNFFALFPPVILLLYPIIGGISKQAFFFWVPYAAIGLSVIPHYLFYWKNEKLAYLTPLLLCFLITVFSEEILSYFSPAHLPVQDILAQSIIFQKLARIFIFLFINISIAYLIRLAGGREESLTQANNQLQEKTALISRQADQLQDINLILQEQHEEIQAQNVELKEKQDELNVQNEELAATLEQLRLMQQQLIEAEKMSSLGVLTAGIAHEINNPVNFISAGIEALKMTLKDLDNLLVLCREPENGNMAEHLAAVEQMKKNIGFDEIRSTIDTLTEHITSGVGRIGEIIRSLRYFSRMDRQEWQECNLNEYLEAAIVLLHHQFRNRIEIVRDLDELPRVQCNPGQINQVFVNILINAMDAIERKGIIKISSAFKSHSNEVEIRIEDNGNGIPEETLPHIFEPFYTTKEVGKGTGLGLAITYGIVESHKGRITVQSKVNEGTIFTIVLPCDQNKSNLSFSHSK